MSDSPQSPPPLPVRSTSCGGDSPFSSFDAVGFPLPPFLLLVYFLFCMSFFCQPVARCSVSCFQSSIWQCFFFLLRTSRVPRSLFCLRPFTSFALGLRCSFAASDLPFLMGHGGMGLFSPKLDFVFFPPLLFYFSFPGTRLSTIPSPVRFAVCLRFRFILTIRPTMSS